MTLPATLHRYEQINLQNLRNLKTCVIYLGAPRNFNDPYDCALGATLSELSDEGLQNLLKGNRVTAPDKDLKKLLKDEAARSLQEHTEKFLNERGVACFTEKPDNLLMWSHYADGGRGMCLAFSSTEKLFEKAQKVVYLDKIPQLDLDAMLCKNEYDAITELYRTKSSHWAYEQEWRVIHERAGTLWCYEAQSLEAVYFGPNAPEDLVEIALLILSGQNETVRFFQGRRSESEFRMLFDEFTYMSHIQAKTKGLLP